MSVSRTDRPKVETIAYSTGAFNNSTRGAHYYKNSPLLTQRYQFIGKDPNSFGVWLFLIRVNHGNIRQDCFICHIITSI